MFLVACTEQTSLRWRAVDPRGALYPREASVAACLQLHSPKLAACEETLSLALGLGITFHCQVVLKQRFLLPESQRRRTATSNSKNTTLSYPTGSAPQRTVYVEHQAKPLSLLRPSGGATAHGIRLSDHLDICTQGRMSWTDDRHRAHTRHRITFNTSTILR